LGYRHEYYHPGARRFSDFFDACPYLVPDYCSSDPDVSFERLLVEALILFCVHTWSPVRFNWGTYRGIRTQLLNDVHRLTTISSNQDVENAMLWIFLNLIDAWRNDGDDERLSATGWTVMALMSSLSLAVADVDSMLNRMKLFFSNGKFERRCRRYIGLLLNIPH
jgi:hypothetical protein